MLFYQNDLHEVVCKYSNYKNMSGKYNIQESFKIYFESDKKFKVIPIDELKTENSWIIEDWWGEKEKI